MADALPAFKYHPDPLTTGSIKASDGSCLACGSARGYIYVGPVYAVDELVDEFCPWCIADGSASSAYSAEFTDVGWGVPLGIAPATIDEVSRRTPGFSGWQQEHWLYHCHDAAAYMGPVGYRELVQVPDALNMLLGEDGHTEAFVRSLDARGNATAYLFRCLACGANLAYADCV